MMNKALWIAQWLLALLFLFAGVSKLFLPAEQLTQGTTLSAGFLRFIGVAEALGALGLVLPGLLRMQTFLTPLAAAGLLVIMIGATVTSLMSAEPVTALIPLLTGLVAAFIAWGRWRRSPHPSRAPRRAA